MQLARATTPERNTDQTQFHHTSRSSPPLDFWNIFGTGTFQREIGDRSGVSQSSVSRALPVCHPWYIKFPYTAVEQVQIKRDFHAITGLPNIIGAISNRLIQKAPVPLWSALSWRPGGCVSIQWGANCSIAQRGHARLFWFATFCTILPWMRVSHYLKQPRQTTCQKTPLMDRPIKVPSRWGNNWLHGFSCSHRAPGHGETFFFKPFSCQTITS